MTMVWGVVGAACQTIADSVAIEGCIPVHRLDSRQWLMRYGNDIDRYRHQNSSTADKSCDVLFLGSSSINLWNSIDADLHPLKIIRRSYGGSTIRDNLFNYNDIAVGFNPKCIAFYIENDLGSHREGITPGETYDLFRIFIGKLHRDYPRCKIFVISFKPSFHKADQLVDQKIINRLLADYASQTPYLHYIDITKVMYDDAGNLRNDIFVNDNLHLNDRGYSLWTMVIKPVLLEEIANYSNSKY